MSEVRPHITIALCTYNGGAFLRAQLQSFLVQTHENWSLWVSDDGSTDETWDILLAFKKQHGHKHDIRLLRGPRQGVCRNFLSLLCHPEFPEGYVALSDQDDVWLKGKLTRALRVMGPDDGRPLLYGARSFHVDQSLHPIGRSRLPRHAPSFENALVQNVVSGHSAVLSPASLRVLRDYGPPQATPFHDWWIYQVVTGAGGRVVFDSRPVLLYRQHGANVLGAPRGVAALALRILAMQKHTYKSWMFANLEALWQRRGLLTAQARGKVQILRSSHRIKGNARVALLKDLGLRRQAAIGTIGLYLAGAMGWV